MVRYNNMMHTAIYCAVTLTTVANKISKQQIGACSATLHGCMHLKVFSIVESLLLKTLKKKQYGTGMDCPDTT